MSTEMYNEHKVKHIRKSRKCFGCNKEFPARRSLWYITCKFDGEFVACHLCNPCKTEVNNGDYADDGYCQGELRYARIERWRDYVIQRRRNNDDPRNTQFLSEAIEEL